MYQIRGPLLVSKNLIIKTKNKQESLSSGKFLYPMKHNLSLWGQLKTLRALVKSRPPLRKKIKEKQKNDPPLKEQYSCTNQVDFIVHSFNIGMYDR